MINMRILGLTLVSMLMLSSVCFSSLTDITYSYNKPRVGVVMLRDQTIINDAELTNELFNGVDDKLNSPQYEYISYSKLRNAWIDYTDRKDIKDLDKVTREQIIAFAKEQNLNYIIYIAVIRNNSNISSDIFNININLGVQMNVKAINVLDNNSLYIDELHETGNGLTLVRAWRNGLPKLLEKFKSQFNVDFRPIISTDEQ